MSVIKILVKKPKIFWNMFFSLKKK